MEGTSAVFSENIEINSQNNTPVFSSILEEGKLYKIEATGVYTYAPGGRIADAEYIYEPDTNTWYEQLNIVNPESNLDLIVDDTSINWMGTQNGIHYSQNTYSPNHTYQTYVIGDNSPISFFIYDSSYDWNDGSLNVLIEEMSINIRDCMNHGWKNYGQIFTNQGMCIKHVLHN